MEILNIEDEDTDKRFIAYGEGFMDGFDGYKANPYVQAFAHECHAWYEKGFDVGTVYAKGRANS